MISKILIGLYQCLYSFSFLFLIACSKDKAVQQSVIIPIKGDPMSFIEGTRGEVSQGLSLELFINQKRWAIFTTGFRTEEQIQVKDQQDIESKNKPTDEDSLKNKENQLVVYRMQESKTAVQTLNRDDKKGIGFKFTKKYDSLFLNNIIINETGQELGEGQFKIHHYSIHKSNKAFSLLISIEEGKNKFLGNFVFIAEDGHSIFANAVDTAYNYLFGPGVGVRWNQSEFLVMSICESELKGLSDLSRDGFDQWSTPLMQRLEIKSVVKPKHECPPFSDLNTNTVLHVKGYIEYYGQETLQQGSTLVVPNFYQSEIIDADIFVLEADWDEAFGNNLKMSDAEVLSNEKFQKIYQATMAHEFGHALGLHHQFTKSTPSIMGYDGVSDLKEYDIKAIRELYPKK